MHHSLKAGIVGWGAYVPTYRVRAKDIARQWGFDERLTDSIWIEEKAVAGSDEDTVTMGWYAARSALARAGVDPQDVGA
ncbi:MAG: hydroxymethylglutaryl-CoA synthase, partial [Zestosphaera sp.]